MKPLAGLSSSRTPVSAQGTTRTDTTKAATPRQMSPTSFACSTVSDIPQTECEALLALYSSTNGATWTNKTGWLATTTAC
jgi:hypothetical protein